MKILLAAIFLSGCTTIKCFSIDGKAANSCKGKERFAKLCKNHNGLKYHLGNIKGVCNDGKEFENE